MSANPASKRVHPAALRTFSLGFMVFLIWIAFAVRVIRLDELPLVLSMDESIDGLDALQLVRAGWLTPFLQNNFGRETLFLYLQGLLLQVIGVSIFGLRFASVFVGTLAIPLTYVVGRQLAMTTNALTSPLVRTVMGSLAATGMAICYWHLFFSRQSLRAISLLPLLLAIVWLVIRADQLSQCDERCSRRWWVLSGLLLGLSQYIYLAARLLPGLFILVTMVWLMRGFRNSIVRRRAVGLAMFWSAAIIVVTPLLVYFINNPQAFSSRVEAISLSGDTLKEALIANLSRVLLIQLGGGIWLGQWPSLHGLVVVFMLIGLAACVRKIRRDTAWFTLVWLVLGWLPVLLSRQNWDATTTILRGIIAWPANCLIAAIGMTTSGTFLYRRLRTPDKKDQALLRRIPGSICIAMPNLLLLVLVGTSSFNNYFGTWATEYNVPDNGYIPALVHHLNRRADGLTLCPRKLCGNPTSMFLLQARYPVLASLSAEQVLTLLPPSKIDIVLPHNEAKLPSNWFLLRPMPNGDGTIYLLPQLANDQVEKLTASASNCKPRLVLNANNDAPGASICTFASDIIHLWEAPLSLQPTDIQWKDEVALTGYTIQPTMTTRNQSVALYLAWRALRFVEGDYDVFIHLYHLASDQRIAQINEALGSSSLSYAQIWPTNLSVTEIHYFTLPSDAPEGVYRFEIGLYHRTSLARLPVIIAGQRAATDSVVLGKLLVQDAPPPPPTFDLLTSFEDNILLRGLDLPTSSASDVLAIVLHWQATGVVAHDYTVFTHLLDEHTNLVVQQDNMPHQGRYPTSLWSPGEVVLDAYALSLPPQMRDGRYRLRIGLYDLPTGRRVRLLGQGQDYVEVMLQRLNGRFSLSGKGR
jgi:hypothetical protein